MTNLLRQDLVQISAMGFGTIKTFYSQYCTIDGKQCVSPTDEARNLGIAILLGVYEFSTHKQEGCNSPEECEAWTVTQVNAAIRDATTYNYIGTVAGIVVGNEDMFDWQGNPWTDMQKRIVDDIKKIQAALQAGIQGGPQSGTSILLPVTTAQRQPDWCGGPKPGCDPKRTNSLNQSDPYGVVTTVDVIGANIYPYWGGSKDPAGAAAGIQTTAANLQQVLQKNVIVTEEGWPSCASSSQNPTTLDDENTYYQTWSKHQNQNFDSYYFSAYNKPSDCQTGGADTQFGLCLADGTRKSQYLPCPARSSLSPRARK
jgi:exo-beta-1,3-glucanase (GH17 family)